MSKIIIPNKEDLLEVGGKCFLVDDENALISGNCGCGCSGGGGNACNCS